MGLTIFKIVFEVAAVIFFLIFVISMESDLDGIMKSLKRMRGMLRQGGDETKAMARMLEEFIGKPCRIQADGVEFDEDDLVVIQEMDGEWMKVGYMEPPARRNAPRKQITQVLRLEDVISIKMEKEITELSLKGGAKPEPGSEEEED